MVSPTKARVVLLASEWGSKHGGLSTFNRVLAIELAKQPEVQVSVLVPRCTQDEKDAAKNNHGIALIQAKQMVGFENKLDLLSFPPDDLQIDFVVGHGVVLGKYAPGIRERYQCKWVQFVHTDPEELGMFKEYDDAISKGEKKHLNEVALCEMADHVVAVGPKLAEAYRSYLRFCGKDEDVFELTPGPFSEFSDAIQSDKDLELCRVLTFGRGDLEDFSPKGFDLAAEAVGRLSDTQLIFVGAHDKSQAEVADRFKEWIRRGRLKIRTFKECREELKKQFSEADIAITPSRTEGFGLAALEAMSAGLPVLVSDNSGFGQALKKATFGSQCVFPSDNATILAEKIKEIWDKNRTIRLKEAKGICQNYGTEYSWEEQCRKLVEEIIKAPSLKLEKKQLGSKDVGPSMIEGYEESPPQEEPNTSHSNAACWKQLGMNYSVLLVVLWVFTAWSSAHVCCNCDSDYLYRSCQEIKDNDPEAVNGVYKIRPLPNADPIQVYCEMTIEGGGFNFLPRGLTRRSGAQNIVNALFKDEKNILLKLQKKADRSEFYTLIQPLPQFTDIDFKVMVNSFAGYTPPKHAHMMEYIFLGILPHRAANNRGQTQGFKSNGHLIQFGNCDGNPNSLFAFLPNHNLQTPSEYHPNLIYENQGVAVNWRSKAAPVTNPDRMMPNEFFFLTELHFGGCGCYTSSDRWTKFGFHATAIGVR